MAEGWSSIDSDALEAFINEIEKQLRAVRRNIRKAQKTSQQMKDKDCDQGTFPDWGLLIEMRQTIRCYEEAKSRLNEAKKSIRVVIGMCRKATDLRHQHYTKQMRREVEKENR